MAARVRTGIEQIVAARPHGRERHYGALRRLRLIVLHLPLDLPAIGAHRDHQLATPARCQVHAGFRDIGSPAPRTLHVQADRRVNGGPINLRLQIAHCEGPVVVDRRLIEQDQD